MLIGLEPLPERRLAGTRRRCAPRRPAGVVHVREDEPPPVRTASEREGELSHVAWIIPIAVRAADVADRVSRRRCERSQPERSAPLPCVRGLDPRAPADRRPSALQDEAILGEERGESGGVTATPGGFVVAEDAV